MSSLSRRFWWLNCATLYHFTLHLKLPLLLPSDRRTCKPFETRCFTRRRNDLLNTAIGILPAALHSVMDSLLGLRKSTFLQRLFFATLYAIRRVTWTSVRTRNIAQDFNFARIKLLFGVYQLLLFDALQLCCRRLWHGCRLSVVCNGCTLEKGWILRENVLNE